MSLLKEDTEILNKVFRVGIDASPVLTARGDNSDPVIELTELAGELASEAEKLEDPQTRWQDIGARRSLFDRALVARLSCTTNPAIDYLIRCFTRCSDLRSRKRDLSPTAEELFAYVSELCVSYASIALLNPSMFPQPPDVEAQGVLRLIPYLKGVLIDHSHAFLHLSLLRNRRQPSAVLL